MGLEMKKDILLPGICVVPSVQMSFGFGTVFPIQRNPMASASTMLVCSLTCAGPTLCPYKQHSLACFLSPLD